MGLVRPYRALVLVGMVPGVLPQPGIGRPVGAGKRAGLYLALSPMASRQSYSSLSHKPYCRGTKGREP
jgi:hypothetical protein